MAIAVEPRVAQKAAYAAASPPRQLERLVALQSYRILDTPVDPAFDDLTMLASYICQTPIAVVNLIDEARQWFKSEVGLGVRELPLDESICAHAILEADLLEISDTLEDPRFRLNPLVTGAPNLRFYAGAVLRNAEGHALGTVCVLDYKPRKLDDTQLTALRALARQAMGQLELRKALAVSDEGLRYRARLMAIAGHDLRQPLQTVSMALDLLDRRSPRPEQVAPLGHARNALREFEHELDRMSALSRLDNPDEIERWAFPIQEVLTMLGDRWSLQASRKSLHLSVLTCDAQVLSNRAMLVTILGNLVGNAIKYTTSGSVTVACARLDGSLIIEVRDTGCGIEAARIATIFLPFTQINHASEGQGLGLSIVRESAQLLGHEIRVSSVQGTGSTFSLLVPLADSALD